MALADDLPADEVRELLQALVRNACVNDGTPASGQEARNAATLRAYLGGTPGVELWEHEPRPGRTSLMARLPGTDPDAPHVGLLGHTDVVPVTPTRWSRDPFGGELVDGEVWGRGTVDMLNLTAAMAVALRHLAQGPRPRAGVTLLAVADEEAGGELGAGWLVQHAWDEVVCDVVLTEAGGLRTLLPGGTRMVFDVAEKGAAWRRLVVTGRASHGSRPYGADNALVQAAEVVRRLAHHRGGSRITRGWREWVVGSGWPPDLEAALLDPARVLDAVDGWPDAERRALGHALTRTTFSPNVVRGGTATNVVPDEVVVEVDVRTLPGTSGVDVDAELRQLLDGLPVRVEPAMEERPATTSPTDTPWWGLLGDLAHQADPDARIIPRTATGGTDAAWFRGRGVPSYGAGLFSPQLDLETYSARFHGPDERVDVASLGLSASFFRAFVEQAGGLPRTPGLPAPHPGPRQ